MPDDASRVAAAVWSRGSIIQILVDASVPPASRRTGAPAAEIVSPASLRNYLYPAYL